MITREIIRELAAFESPEGCAVTFYFQPDTPQNKSHREEAILVKDLVRGALREAEREGGKIACARGDLRRILDIADHMHNNSGKAKAIFADSSKGIWHEFDIAPTLEKTQLIVNRRFHLKPLTPVIEHAPTVMVCVMDRSKARLFRFERDKVEEMADFFNQVPRRGRSDGWAGYDAGHAERKVMNDARQHFKFVCETLLELYQRDGFEMLVIGCRDEQWSEIEPVLHSDLKKSLLGHFRIDPALADLEEIREKTESILEEHRVGRLEGLVREVLGEAHRNARGAIGLRRVLRSLETGEVQTLLIGRQFKASGYECGNCGHIDFGDVRQCAACGQHPKPVDDVSDAILGSALRNNIEVMYVEDHPEFEKAGHIGALLRFRADQNTPMKLAG